MPILSVLYLKCHFCDEVSDRFDGAIFTPKDVRDELKGDGWRRRRTKFGTVDECPACAAESAPRKKAA